MRTLYRASRVHTLASPRPGEWLLVDGRHVERVGTGEPPSADRVVDVPGTTILPGFVDAHVHLSGSGEHGQAPEVAAARSAHGLLDAVRDAAGRLDGPVLVHGYDESTWTDRTIPSLVELDGACDRPLAVVRVDGHLSLANTAALKESGVLDRDGVQRDEDGQPTGVVTRSALEALRRWFAMHVAETDVERLQLAAASLAVSVGVTTVHEMSMPSLRGIRDIEILLGHRARLPVDVVTYVATTDIPQVMDLGMGRIGGDLPVDGSIGARTAHVSEPYEDVGGTGARYFEDDALAMFFREGHLAGLQVGVHAIGDAAIEQVVATWERVYQALDTRERRHFRARRHRIEHFEMADGPTMERAAALGLGIGIQPLFDAHWGFPGGLYEQGLGPDRAAGMNRFRDLLERGLVVGTGSDSPITALDPMGAVSALEHHHDPAQRLSRAEALHLCTTGGARLAHQDDKKGTLEPGKHADFAAYDVDPLVAEDLAGVRPVLTVSLGRDVYAA
jgi:predicted amidohydrolase YtcJ